MRQKLVICAQWLENYVPKPHSCLVHPSPRCAEASAPWHTNANQFLHLVPALLPFLIQPPTVRLLLENLPRVLEVQSQFVHGHLGFLFCSV